MTLARFWPFDRVRAGEGERVTVFALQAFLMLVVYYLLKTMREPILLQGGSAELKSYAYAVIALAMLFLLPLYGVAFRLMEPRSLLRWMTGLLAIGLAAFSMMGRSGMDIGFCYYVWVGVLGILILTQLWAHAAHVFGVERGQRVFPVIMVGAVLGGLAGPILYEACSRALEPWDLMLLTTGMLFASLPLITRMSPFPGQDGAESAASPRTGAMAGLARVLLDRYLLLLAGMAVLLNCVNTTGEYMLADFVVRYADQQAIANSSIDKQAFIGSFYADYYLSINVLTTVLQVVVVGKLFRWIGISGALFVLPVIAIIGYGLIGLVPVFAIIRAIKVLENSTDYSLMNTARHALYLPLPFDKKFEGKIAVDTVFWRLGDLVQAAVVFAGLRWLGFELRDFALLNVALALVWLFIAIHLGRGYTRRVQPGFRVNWRGLGLGLATATAACVAFVVPARATADELPIAHALFEDDQALDIELRMDGRTLCLHPERERCEDAPVSLIYRSDDETRHHVDARVRVRGRVRTGSCSFPALFVFFDESTTPGTLFDGERMLPLTTHCKKVPSYYEEYVLKEYLAYRVYNELSDKSLRVRLARVTYVDTRRPKRSFTRYAFFTEHFEALARRHAAEVWQPERFDPNDADPLELGTFELFQYLIGNTDWSVIYRHNVVLVRDAAGRATAVPYDFDYSGLVDAEYAVPPPHLRISRVTQRLFRGFCRDSSEWGELSSRFERLRGTLPALIGGLPRLDSRQRESMSDFLGGFYSVLESPDLRRQEIGDVCRPQ